MNLAQHLEFPGVAGFDDLDCDSARFLVFIIVIVIVILVVILTTFSFSPNSLGRKYSPETTLAKFFIHLEVYVFELQRECLIASQ